ncbi:MAG TPA: NUDIX domain-containing protein [Candidatus Nanoarchaeia archaeon]|nr:NUDIX domain-containing protein [Candidatus Nanoarchaeia archaeon]
MPHERSFGSVIIRKEGNNVFYLLLYRKSHGNYKESWDFPRGLIEKDENPEDTVKREVKEETGLTNLKFIKGFKETIKWFYRKDGMLISKEATYFLAETSSKEIKLSKEHDGYRWCIYEEALKLIKFENTRNILNKAREFLANSLFFYCWL